MGKEQGETGTPHLQGFLILQNPQRLSFLKRRLHATAHFENARGTSEEASVYCKKDGDYQEYGKLPNEPRGAGKQFLEFKAWVEEQDKIPTEREVCIAFPALYGRYKRSILDMVQHFRPLPVLMDVEEVTLRDWQEDLVEYIEGEPDDRKIRFIVDGEGSAGKSFLTRYLITKYPERVQTLRIGKRDDLAHAIDVTKSVFIFDIPRGQLEFFQFNILEQLKDRLVFSPKYESQSKLLHVKPHVVVFTNEDVPLYKLTADRYDIVTLSEPAAHNILT